MRHIISPKRRMMGLIFLLVWRVFMDRIKMNNKMDKTFEEGFEEYVLDMKARNLRQGTISHYKDAIRQIYKRIPPTTMISTLSKRTMKEFYEWRFRRVGIANYTKQSKKRNGERKGKGSSNW